MAQQPAGATPGSDDVSASGPSPVPRDPVPQGYRNVRDPATELWHCVSELEFGQSLERRHPASELAFWQSVSAPWPKSIPLQLRVVGLSGQLCQVDAQSAWHVMKLKQKISAKTHIPAESMRLAVGTCVLKDEDCLDKTTTSNRADVTLMRVSEMASAFKLKPKRAPQRRDPVPQPNHDAAPDCRFEVNYSTSSAGRCGACPNGIQIGQLRMRQWHWHTGSRTTTAGGLYHIRCVPEAMKKRLRREVPRASVLPGFELLRAADRPRVERFFPMVVKPKAKATRAPKPVKMKVKAKVATKAIVAKRSAASRA